MKKNLLIIIFVIGSSLYAQQNDLNGTWLLTTINTPIKTQNPYLLFGFHNSRISINQMDIGGFKKHKNLLEISSPKFKAFNGKAQIIRHIPNELIFKLNKAVYHFVSYNPEQIKNDPLYKNITGVWEIKGEDKTLFEFRPGGEVSQLVLSNDGSSISTEGQWIFIPQEKAVILLGDFEIFGKKSFVKNISHAYMEIENNGINYLFERKKRIEKTPRLSFQLQEIEAEASEIYDLPWSDEAMMGYWKNGDEIHYNQCYYEPVVHSFSSEKIIAKVKKNPDEISFVYYLVTGKDTIRKREEIKGPLSNRYNPFFPQKNISPFRIINNFEIININGKEHHCTVVEGFDGDTKVKYWMINYMPGVFAKIIKNNETGFSNPFYSVTKWNP